MQQTSVGDRRTSSSFRRAEKLPIVGFRKAMGKKFLKSHGAAKKCKLRSDNRNLQNGIV